MFPYDGRYYIPNRADSVPGHCLLSDRSRRQERREKERVSVELGYRHMVVFSNELRSLPLLPHTHNMSVAAIISPPASLSFFLSLSLSLWAPGPNNEVCSCFVISSLERKWDENRIGYVQGPSFSSLLSHAKTFFNVGLLLE